MSRDPRRRKHRLLPVYRTPQRKQTDPRRAGRLAKEPAANGLFKIVDYAPHDAVLCGIPDADLLIKELCFNIEVYTIIGSRYKLEVSGFCDKDKDKFLKKLEEESIMGVRFPPWTARLSRAWLGATNGQKEPPYTAGGSVLQESEQGPRP